MIKAVLKRNNILLSDFADKLNISRPTLDTYIRNYDSGGRLSNSLFQKIFDFLFSDSQMTNEEFVRRYNYIIDNYGKNAELSAFSTGGPLLPSGEENASDAPKALYDALDEEAFAKRFSRDEYTVLANLIKKDNGLLHCVFKYFLIWKNKLSLSDLSTAERMMAIEFYRFDQKVKAGDMTYSEEEYRKLEEAIDRKNNPEKYSSGCDRKTIDEISASITELLANNKGLSLEDIVEQIKKKI